MSEIHTCRADLQVDGLQDGCPRCTELAEHPIRDLDETMLAGLVTSAVARSGARTADQYSRPNSTAMLVAETNVLSVLERIGRLAECAPEEVARYLRDLWSLPCEIHARPMSEREREMRERIG